MRRALLLLVAFVSTSQLTVKGQELGVGAVPLTLSEAVGDTIDAAEARRYGVLSRVQNLRWAVYYRTPGKRYVVKLSKLGEDGTEVIEFNRVSSIGVDMVRKRLAAPSEQETLSLPKRSEIDEPRRSTLSPTPRRASAPRHGLVLPAGRRVRITSKSEKKQWFTRKKLKGSVLIGQIVGTVVRLDSDSLVVSEGEAESLAIPLASVARIEVSMGQKRNAGTGALIGLLVGVGSGALAGYSAGDDEPGIISFTAGEKAALGGVLLGAVGLVIGTVYGPAEKTEKWKPVSLDRMAIGITPQRHGGLALAASFRF